MKAVGCTLGWGDGHRRGELRGERWSGEPSGLKCVKDREGDLTRKRLCDEGSVCVTRGASAAAVRMMEG